LNEGASEPNAIAQARFIAGLPLPLTMTRALGILA
jgi:hypothetical protein